MLKTKPDVHPQLQPASKVLSGYLLTFFFQIYTIFNCLLSLQFEAQTCPTMEGYLRNLLTHGTQLHHFYVQFISHNLYASNSNPMLILEDNSHDFDKFT
jgi:hypothetical protein